MSVLIFDTESSGAIRNKGHPFDPRNKLMCLSYTGFVPSAVIKIEYDESPYGDKLNQFSTFVDNASLIVGFNLKYDIHWMRRYGVEFKGKRIWDCQLYHFIQSNQKHKFPSLDDVAVHWGIPKKLDIVKKEYWDKGIDTDKVPWDILSEYSLHDVDPVTKGIFEKQWTEFQTLPEARRKLIQLHMRDLLVLEEMEFNGALYNVERSRKTGKDLEVAIANIDADLYKYCNCSSINFNSDEHISAFLYGGIVKEEKVETYLFTYKDPKKGAVEKSRKMMVEHTLPRIIEPLPHTEKQKDGIWAVDKTTLKKLQYKQKGWKNKILELLLKRSALEKQKSTYCFGTPKLMEEMGWEGNIIHGQFNQPVTITGRLSSSKPNLQNQQEAMQVCFETRFKWKYGQMGRRVSRSQ